MLPKKLRNFLNTYFLIPEQCITSACSSSVAMTQLRVACGVTTNTLSVGRTVQLLTERNVCFIPHRTRQAVELFSSAGSYGHQNDAQFKCPCYLAWNLTVIIVLQRDYVTPSRRPELNAPTGRLKRKQHLWNNSSPFGDKDDIAVAGENNRKLHGAESFLWS